MLALIEGHPNVDVINFYILASALLTFILYRHHRKALTGDANRLGLGSQGGSRFPGASRLDPSDFGSLWAESGVLRAFRFLNPDFRCHWR